MNLKKESDVNFNRLNNLAKGDDLKVEESDYKDHIMFMAGNTILNDKIVALKDQSLTYQCNDTSYKVKYEFLQFPSFSQYRTKIQE